MPCCRPVTFAFLIVCAVGCGSVPPMPGPLVLPGDTTVVPGETVVAPSPIVTGVPNPILVPQPNRDVVWEQVVDVVDDYFRIERERRVRLVGNVLTEGLIDTFPQDGATWFEPHLGDTVGGYNRTESTLQTIRRRAVVRVIPSDGGFLVDIAVYKELEDLDQPQWATAGAATFRYDNSLPSPATPDREKEMRRRWIPQGRDIALEQHMLAQLLDRTGLIIPAPAPF